MKKITLFFCCVLQSFSLIAGGSAGLYDISLRGDTSTVYDSLSQGFCEIGNKILLHEDYQRLYESFDQFIYLVDSDEQFAQTLEKMEKEFLLDVNIKNRYCSAPPSYRDPKRHTTKRFNKIYFQYIDEYRDFISTQYPIVVSNPVVKSFLDNMEYLDQTAKTIFTDIVEQLEKESPGIKALIYGKYKELTVISKIIRYKKSDAWGTTPHQDKSCITLIWHSDDDNNDCLLLCDDVENPAMDKLGKPNRVFANKDDQTSTLLIPGAALDKFGVSLKPVIHGVAPLKDEYRHAVISFLLIPDIDMSDIMSDFVEPTKG